MVACGAVVRGRALRLGTGPVPDGKGGPQPPGAYGACASNHAEQVNASELGATRTYMFLELPAEDQCFNLRARRWESRLQPRRV